MKQLILILFFALCTSCGAKSTSCEDVNGGCSNLESAPAKLLKRSWIIDEEFTVSDATDIQNAILHWSTATDGLFEPDDVSIGPVEKNQSFAIEYVTPDDPRVKRIEEIYRERNDPISLAGRFAPDYNSIFLVDGRSSSILKIALHELGHFFGLKHAEECDVMTRGPSRDCISQRNINELCELYDCSGYDPLPTCVTQCVEE